MMSLSTTTINPLPPMPCARSGTVAGGRSAACSRKRKFPARVLDEPTPAASLPARRNGSMVRLRASPHRRPAYATMRPATPLTSPMRYRCARRRRPRCFAGCGAGSCCRPHSGAFRAASPSSSVTSACWMEPGFRPRCWSGSSRPSCPMPGSSDSVQALDVSFYQLIRCSGCSWRHRSGPITEDCCPGMCWLRELVGNLGDVHPYLSPPNC